MSAPKLRLVDGKAGTVRKRTGKTTTARDAVPPAKSASSEEKRATTNATREHPKPPKAARGVKPEPGARDLMSTPAVCCGEHDTLNKAAELLWNHNLGIAVVVDQLNHPVGVISDRDICFGAYTQGVALWGGSVSSAMSKTVHSCGLDTPVTEVREIMRRAAVRRLVVVDDDGTAAGVIGLTDLIDEAERPLAKTRRRGSSAPQLVQLMGAILARGAR